MCQVACAAPVRDPVRSHGFPVLAFYTRSRHAISTASISNAVFHSLVLLKSSLVLAPFPNVLCSRCLWCHTHSNHS